MVGQSEARYALEVAAAGGHHMLMIGPPGAGKTMLAQRLPGILPDLNDADAVTVTSVHSLAHWKPKKAYCAGPHCAAHTIAPPAQPLWGEAQGWPGRGIFH